MNPFELIALKQKVGREYADEAELFVLIHFDAAHRKVLGPIGYNFISRHLVMAHYLAVRLKSRSFLTISECAGTLWRKAGMRPEDDLGLTTKEYRAIRACLGVYFRHLPYTEIGMYVEACQIADRLMNETKSVA